MFQTVQKGLHSASCRQSSELPPCPLTSLESYIPMNTSTSRSRSPFPAPQARLANPPTKRLSSAAYLRKSQPHWRSTAFRPTRRARSAVSAKLSTEERTDVTLFESVVPAEVRELVGLRRAGSEGAVQPREKYTVGTSSDLESLKEAALAPPELPGVPRPLWQVMLFSIPTGLVWYGWYKFCVEEEVAYFERERFGSASGFGGYATLGPFTLGLALGPLAEALDLPGGAAWSAVGVIWIYYTQYLLYQRVNAMYEDQGMEAPLEVWWLVFPGFNLIVGLRQVHFLAAYWAMARQPGGVSDANIGALVDPVAELFPFISAPKYTWKKFLRSPRMWLSFLKDADDLQVEFLQEDQTVKRQSRD